MFLRLLFGVAMVAAVTVPAAPAVAAGNLASVDFQRLVKEAPQVKASNDILKRQLAPREKAIKQQRQRVESLRKGYAALGPGTNPLQRASAAENLENAQKKLGQLESQYSSTLTLRGRQFQTNFQTIVNQDVEAYAKAHGYTLVVDEAVLYSGSATDITDAILAILKAQYRKVRAAADQGKKGQ